MRAFFIFLVIILAVGYVFPVFAADPVAVRAPDERLGIETGYFSCTLPEGWTRQDDDGRDDKSYMIIFYGPRAESSPVMIYIEYFADGSKYFDDDADFIERNTFDSWEDKLIAYPKATLINGVKGVWFEREQETSLNPESPLSGTVMVKEKFYVFRGKDQKGFFVLHYYAPKSVFDVHSEKFEKIAGSFKLL